MTPFQLDVLAGRRFLPHDGLRHALDGPGLHARNVHALAIDPRREVRGHRHVGGERDDAIQDSDGDPPLINTRLPLQLSLDVVADLVVTLHRFSF